MMQQPMFAAVSFIRRNLVTSAVARITKILFVARILSCERPHDMTRLLDDITLN